MLYLNYVWHNRVLPVVYDYLLGQKRLYLVPEYECDCVISINISVGLVSDFETLA
jgi:hypothetical protein